MKPGGIRRHDKQRLSAFGEDEEADRARETRGAVIFAREADGDADREQQSEMRKDRVAGRGDEAGR